MITQDTIKMWKQSKESFYLGRWQWLNLVSNTWKNKSKAKTKSKNFQQVDTNKKVKKWKLYKTSDDSKSVAMVTLSDVEKMKKAGIKVYAEKDGFLC